MPPGMGHPQPPWATCSVRHHPLGEKHPPNIQPKPPLSQFKTILPCPLTIHPRKQPFLLLFIHSLQVLEGHNEVSREPSLCIATVKINRYSLTLSWSALYRAVFVYICSHIKLCQRCSNELSTSAKKTWETRSTLKR